jgi:protocatechuate 3,4-dioxygenase beta subunit
VLDPGGRPVAGAEVRLLGADGGEHALLPLEQPKNTDPQGGFELQAPDGAVIEARHSGFTPGRAVVDFPAQVSRRVVIRLGPSGSEATEHPLAGRVVDSHGMGVEGALVRASFSSVRNGSDAPHASAEATTDDEGRFSLRGLDEGMYQVRATHVGFGPAPAQEVAAGRRDLLLTLTTGCRLVGVVRDAETHEPIPSFAVHVWRRPDALQLLRIAGAAMADPGGRFVLDDLPAGALVVTAAADGYASTREQIVELGATPAHAEFELKRGSRLQGQVLDRSSRQPIEGARIEGTLAEPPAPP